MDITLKSRTARRLLIFLETLVFFTALVWISKTYVAGYIGEKATIENLQLAIRFDPDNFDYHLRLGRLFQYNLMDVNPDLALAHLKRATELTPLDPQPWLDLGAALEFQGRNDEAEACLRRADSLAPNHTALQWAIGNFFLLHGKVDEAFKHFKIVLAGTSQYNELLFSTAWKASGDADKILRDLIPEYVPTEFDYLYYLEKRALFTEARSVWKRIAAGSETFPPVQVSRYIDRLVHAQRPADAYEVWSDLRGKGLIRPTYQATNKNLVLNGDFEEELLRWGFDWRIPPREGVFVGLAQTTFHSPSHSILVQFSGKENIDYRQVFQLVRVSPGQTYHLRGFLKTEGITTDSGPRLMVRDFYNSGALEKFSEDLIGSTTGWTPLRLDFTTGPKTELLVVGVARLPSRKLDNLIAGKVWMDDVALAPLDKAGSSEN